MKKLFLLYVFIFSLIAQGQTTFKYSYDDRGNRCKREIIIPAIRSAQAHDPESESVPFTESLEQRTIVIYPNPTKDELNITITDTEHLQSGSIILYDLHGKMLMERIVKENHTSFDLSSYSKGTYLLFFKLDEETSSWKIIKE